MPGVQDASKTLSYYYHTHSCLFKSSWPPGASRIKPRFSPIGKPGLSSSVPFVPSPICCSTFQRPPDHAQGRACSQDSQGSGGTFRHYVFRHLELTGAEDPGRRFYSRPGGWLGGPQCLLTTGWGRRSWHSLLPWGSLTWGQRRASSLRASLRQGEFRSGHRRKTFRRGKRGT